MNLKEQEIWTLINSYGLQLHQLPSSARSDFGHSGNAKQEAVEAIERLQTLVKDLP